MSKNQGETGVTGRLHCTRWLFVVKETQRLGGLKAICTGREPDPVEMLYSPKTQFAEGQILAD